MAHQLRTPPAAADIAGPALDRQVLAERYQQVRQSTEALCAPLTVEDYVIQSMPDCSPTRWHLAHVSWFFETFLLKPTVADYQPVDPRYAYLFNSYYNAAGDKYPRPQRGLLSRPTVDEVYRYRKHVDEHVLDLIECAGDQTPTVASIVTLGLNHEQQHQELIVTDLKHALSHNPLHPEYAARSPEAPAETGAMGWIDFPEGVYWIGHEGGDFAFDNEERRHRVFLDAYRLGSRLVTNAEYLRFMGDAGYERPEFWLSMGWATVQQEGWQAPLYWQQEDHGGWSQYTLAGLRPVDLAEPVAHVSYFEADAYARWAGARLPTEAEWEVAAETVPIGGNFVETGRFHPAALDPSLANGGLAQMFGDVWEWTQSSYSPYPGFQIAPGALGEYNGKFMCNQYVLRGGSCATPQSHIRPTYRNFFPPDARWQFSGVRLAKDA
jgi:ergothioneine biosynthesis protein EgtB